LEIRQGIVKQGKRGVFSQLFHSKNTKEKISGWKIGLNRALLVFNVSFVVRARQPPLSARFQTELAINTHVVVTDIRQDVASTRTVVTDVRKDVVDTRTIVTDVRHDVKDTHDIVSSVHHDVKDTRDVVSTTHTIVTDIHRNLLKSQEEGGGKDQSVSVMSTRAYRMSADHHPGSNQVSSSLINKSSL